MFSKIRQSISAREAFELVKADLELVEREISVESVASNHAITTINQYLQSGGGKRLRPRVGPSQPFIWPRSRVRLDYWELASALRRAGFRAR